MKGTATIYIILNSAFYPLDVFKQFSVISDLAVFVRLPYVHVNFAAFELFTYISRHMSFLGDIFTKGGYRLSIPLTVTVYFVSELCGP